MNKNVYLKTTLITLGCVIGNNDFFDNLICGGC